MKSLIVYSSRHHGSTEKLVKAIAEKYPVDLLDAEREKNIDFANYDLIGFASGIDFGKFYPAVTEAAQTLPAGKKVYALFTCAKDNGKYGDEIQKIAGEKGCLGMGKYGCRGFNTYGPWKLVGGMNKNHPSSEELQGAVQFYEKVMAAAERLF